ncbi:MAG: DUF6259 domain-containing protein [Planctomycetota bacterium]|jgi:hypothetical protein
MLLKNEKISLRFDDFGRLTDMTGFNDGVTAPIDDGALTEVWEIQLRDSDGKVVTVKPEDVVPEINLHKSEKAQRLEFVWSISNASGSIKVIGTVDLPNNSQLSYWSLTVENSTGQAVYQVNYPRLSGLQDYKAHNGKPGWLSAPVMMGEKTPDPVDFVNNHQPQIDVWAREQYGAFDIEGGPADIAYAYPGYWTMQFIAFGHPDSGGIYLGAYDSQALYKCYGMYKDGDSGQHSVMQMKQYPEDRTEAGADFKSSYQCPVGLYEGEWWNASEIYREWALQQFWTEKGPLRGRDEVPDWVKENDLWYWNWQFGHAGHPKNITPIAKALKQKFNCNLAVHWYGSNGEDFSSPFRFPEIYPHSESIRYVAKKGTDDLHDDGIHCIPYLDTRLWNEDTESFRKADAMRFIAMNENGKSADFWPSFGHTMCPTAQPFHNMILQEMTKTMDDCGFDGAYLDQVSGCYPVPCFNPEHDHAPGGHDHWVRGYRELLEKARAEMRKRKPDSIITSEGVTECFIDMLDLDLAREISNLKGHVGSHQSLPIPMFHSVYHDYHISYGTVSTFVPTPGAAVIPEHFYYSEALTLVGGGQLMISGLFAGDETKEKFQPLLNYMENLTRARISARKFFNLGRWLPPLEIDCEATEVPFTDKLKKKNIPVILSGCFEFEGELCAALVNHTGREVSGTVNFYPKLYGLSDAVKAKMIYPNSESFKIDSSFEVNLQPYEVRIIIVSSNN